MHLGSNMLPRLLSLQPLQSYIMQSLQSKDPLTLLIALEYLQLEKKMETLSFLPSHNT